MSLVKTKHSEIFKQTSDELPVIGTSVLNLKCITPVGFVSLQPNILKWMYSAHWKYLVAKKVMNERDWWQ